MLGNFLLKNYDTPNVVLFGVEKDAFSEQCFETDDKSGA